ncbi:MAG: DUF4153 domain-containing protein [Oligoflexia bacterium]|nr:DUF4153 domain-containing protein [Oligoflexia bacterium]
MLQFKSISYIYENAKDALIRFPFVLLSALIAFIDIVYNIENNKNSDDYLSFYFFALGIPLFLALRLFLESFEVRSKLKCLILYLLGTLALYLFYLQYKSNFTNSTFLKLLLLALEIHLLVAFIAFLRKGTSADFWNFNKAIFIRILLSSLYAAVFFIGISGALGAISVLFSVKINSKLYQELWFFSVLIVQTWYFLSGVPKELYSNTSIYNVPKGLKIFVQYLLIPLVSLYMVIMYCYMFKIGLTWDWPKGYIGWLVSVISVLGVFNLLLVEPEKEKIENKWISVYAKYFYILLLPLIGLLFVALYKRTAEYGITEPRFFLMTIGLFLLMLSSYFLFSKRKNIKIIPISIFIISVLISYGPWSAFSISLRSQKNRVIEIAQANNMLDDQGKLIATKNKVAQETEQELSSIFDYIIRNHGFDGLTSFLDTDIVSKIFYIDTVSYNYRVRYLNAKSLMSHLGLNYFQGSYLNNQQWFSFVAKRSQVYDLRNYRLLVNYQTKYDDEDRVKIAIDGQAYTLKIKKQESAIELWDGSEMVAQFTFKDYLLKIRENNPKKLAENASNELLDNNKFTNEVGKTKKIDFYLESIHGNYTNNNEVNMSGLSGFFLVR